MFTAGLQRKGANLLYLTYMYVCEHIYLTMQMCEGRLRLQHPLDDIVAAPDEEYPSVSLNQSLSPAASPTALLHPHTQLISTFPLVMVCSERRRNQFFIHDISFWQHAARGACRGKVEQKASKSDAFVPKVGRNTGFSLQIQHHLISFMLEQIETIKITFSLLLAPVQQGFCESTLDTEAPKHHPQHRYGNSPMQPPLVSPW